MAKPLARSSAAFDHETRPGFHPHATRSRVAAAAYGGRCALNRWKIGVAVGLLLGLVLTVAVVLHVGWASLWAAIQRIGVTGFAVFTLYSLAGFLPLGWAWQAVAPGAGP